MTGLEDLPSRTERVELQIVQFRSETRDEFSAVRQELRTLDTRLGSVETRLGSVETRLGSVETGLGSVETRLGSVETGLGSLETGLREAIEDARRETRMLFEEVVSRIALLSEYRAASGRRAKKPKKT